MNLPKIPIKPRLYIDFYFFVVYIRSGQKAECVFLLKTKAPKIFNKGKRKRNDTNGGAS